MHNSKKFPLFWTTIVYEPFVIKKQMKDACKEQRFPLTTIFGNHLSLLSSEI